MYNNDIVTHSVSNTILAYTQAEMNKLNDIIRRIEISGDDSATLVADSEHGFHIEANGDIKGYKVCLDPDDPSLTGCDFESFIHDLQDFIEENEPFSDTPDYIYIKRSYNTDFTDYILISKDNYTVADFDDIMELVISHIDEL